MKKVLFHLLQVILQDFYIFFFRIRISVLKPVQSTFGLLQFQIQVR